MHNRGPAFWVLLASLLFATMCALVKMAAVGVSLPEIVFFRTLPGALVLFTYARTRGLVVATPNWKLHALRSVAGVSGMFLGFYAVSRLPLATATTLDYTTPVFMLAYIAIVARSRPTPPMLFAMIGGFAGVLVLLRPTLQAGQTLAFVAGLVSAVLARVAYAQIRRLGDAGEPPWRIVLWNSISGAVLAAGLLPFSGPSEYTAKTVITLAGIGVVGLFAQLAMTRAFSRGSTTWLASLQYSTVAFSAMYGVLIWGDTLSPASVLGLALIVLSSIVALRRRGRAIVVES